jgi:hypothetical protein
MSNHRHNPAWSRRDQEISICDHVVGGGGGNPTLPMVAKYGAYIDTMIRTGTGTYTGTLRDSYPELCGIAFIFVGTTAGLDVRFTAIDVVAKTFALTAEVGAVATDMAATDTLYLTFRVRNSGQNQ